MSALVANDIIKPPLWVPGRNPDALDLWRGCRLYLPLWEGVGDRVYSVAPWPLLGTCDSANWTIGQHGSGLAGDSDSIIADGDQHLQASAFSAFVVFEGTDTGANSDGIFTSGTTAAGGSWAIYIDATTGLLRGHFQSTGGAINITGTTAPDPDDWHSAAYTGDASATRLYVDGVQEASGAGGTLLTGAWNVYVGSWGGAADRVLDGTVALIAYWDRALEASEVATLAADPFMMIRPPDFSPFWGQFVDTAVSSQRLITGQVALSGVTGAVTQQRVTGVVSKQQVSGDVN